jgi:hypothetical protein
MFIPIFDRSKSLLTIPHMTFCLPLPRRRAFLLSSENNQIPPDILKLRSELSLFRDIRLKW